MSGELKTVEVEEVTFDDADAPEKWPTCHMCNDRLVFSAATNDSSRSSAFCHCGIWEFTHDMLVTETIVARHPWGMKSAGLSISQAVQRMVL